MGAPADRAAADDAGLRGRTAAGSDRLGWLAWTTLGLSVAGLLAAGYLTYEHLTASTTLACPDTGAINCVKVTTSDYARFLGAPVALLGLGFFVAMTALCSPPAWRTSRRWVPVVRLAASGIGVLFVCYLVWAELFRVDAICLWCTAVHVITVALFVCLVLGSAFARPSGLPEERG